MILREEDRNMIYVIRGKYPGCPWEDIDEADTRDEAQRLLGEYQTAYGPEWSLTIKVRRAAE